MNQGPTMTRSIFFYSTSCVTPEKIISMSYFARFFNSSNISSNQMTKVNTEIYRKRQIPIDKVFAHCG